MAVPVQHQTENLSATAHTPGPWEQHNKSSVRVCVPDPSTPKLCRSVAEAEIIGMDRKEAEANARLIAAAPEMLEALEALLDIAPLAKDVATKHIHDAASAAIQKARGGQ